MKAIQKYLADDNQKVRTAVSRMQLCISWNYVYIESFTASKANNDTVEDQQEKSSLHPVIEQQLKI